VRLKTRKTTSSFGTKGQGHFLNLRQRLQQGDRHPTTIAAPTTGPAPTTTIQIAALH